MPPPILSTVSLAGAQSAIGVNLAALEGSSALPSVISQVGSDGFMATSALSPWQAPLGDGGRFDLPAIFDPRWGALLRDQNASSPSPAEEARRVPSVPPPGAGREKAMGIIGRSIYRELNDCGYDAKQIVSVASELLALITDIMLEKRGEGRRIQKSDEKKKALDGDVATRYRGVFSELLASGCVHSDLIWIANELIAQVTQRIAGS